ncbi:MKRN2 opposite strand, tandem duplicate 1 [Aplochiton taeniatus]
MDRSLLKFKHCGKTIYTFDDLNNSNDLLQPAEPKRCPICHERMRFGLLDAPVIVPNPFRNGHLVSCAFLIGSQLGPAFISERHESELHVGVTNCKGVLMCFNSPFPGVVYSYTESGVQRQQQGWEQCICVPLVRPGHHSPRANWDLELETLSCQPAWEPHRFAEEREFGSCCYGYALSFINEMRKLENRHFLSRDAFTSQYILPWLETASSYVRVYLESSDAIRDKEAVSKAPSAT